MCWHLHLGQSSEDFSSAWATSFGIRYAIRTLEHSSVPCFPRAQLRCAKVPGSGDPQNGEQASNNGELVASQFNLFKAISFWCVYCKG